MLRIAPKYLLIETLSNFITGLAVFSFILIMSKLFQLTEMILEYNFDIIIVIKLCLFILPEFLVFTIPMSLLFSVILALGRMSSDYEIVALKTAGVSLFQLVRPIIIFSILCCLTSAYFTFYVAPKRNFNFQKTIVHNLNASLRSLIKERQFNFFNDIVVYVDRIPPRSNKLYGIIIYDDTNLNEQITLIAQEGQIISNESDFSFVIKLKNAYMFMKNNETNGSRTIRFDSYDLKVVPFKEYKERERFTIHQSYFEMTLDELYPKLDELRDTLDRHIVISGSGSIGEEELKQNRLAIEYYISQIRRCKVEISKRYAIPFACIVFMLLGIPLGIQLELKKGFGSYTAALIIFFLYYMLITLGEKMGKYGYINPFFSFWFGNIIFFIAGLYMFIQTGRESHLKIITFFKDMESPKTMLEKALRRLLDKKHGNAE